MFRHAVEYAESTPPPSPPPTRPLPPVVERNQKKNCSIANAIYICTYYLCDRLTKLIYKYYEGWMTTVKNSKQKMKDFKTTIDKAI